MGGKHCETPAITSPHLVSGIQNRQTGRHKPIKQQNYNWYIDQTNTGTYSNMNCGRPAPTMTLMWVNKDFNHSAEEARNTYLLNGGAWSTQKPLWII